MRTREALLPDAEQIHGLIAAYSGDGTLLPRTFAEVCENCNIKFIGPASPSIRSMGDKVAARETMRKAGVPVVPGSDGPVENEQDALKIARRIG